MPKIWNGYKYVEEDSPEGQKVKARDAKRDVVSKVDKGISTIQANEAGRERDKGYASLQHIANQLVPGSYPGHNPGGWAENGATFKTPYKSRVLTSAPAAKPAPAPAPAASTPAPTGQAAATGTKRKQVAAQARRDVPFFGKGVTDNRIKEQAQLDSTPSGPPADYPQVMEESRPRGKDAEQWVKDEKRDTGPAKNTDAPINREDWARKFQSQTAEQQADQTPLLEAVGNRQLTSDEKAAKYKAESAPVDPAKQVREEVRADGGDEPEPVDNPREEAAEKAKPAIVVKDGKWQRAEPAPAAAPAAQPAAAPAAAPATDPKTGAAGQASPGNSPVAATPAVLQKPNLLAVATNARYQPSAFGQPADAVSANPPAYVAPAADPTTVQPGPTAAAAAAPAAVAAPAGPKVGIGNAVPQPPPPTPVQQAAAGVANPAPEPAPPKTPRQIAQEAQLASPIQYHEDAPSQNVEGKPYPRLPLPAMPDNVSQEQLIKDAEAKATAGGAYEKPNGGLMKRIAMSLLKYGQGIAEGMVKSDKPFGFAALNDAVGGGVQKAADYQSNEEDRAAWRQRRDDELQRTLPAASAKQHDVDAKRKAEEDQYTLERQQDLEAEARNKIEQDRQERQRKFAEIQRYNNERLKTLNLQAEAKITANSAKGNLGQSKALTAQVEKWKNDISVAQDRINWFQQQLNTVVNPADTATVKSYSDQIASLNAGIDSIHKQWEAALAQPDPPQTASPSQFDKLKSDPLGQSLIQQWKAAQTPQQKRYYASLLNKRVAELGGQ